MRAHHWLAVAWKHNYSLVLQFAQLIGNFFGQSLRHKQVLIRVFALIDPRTKNAFPIAQFSRIYIYPTEQWQPIAHLHMINVMRFSAQILFSTFVEHSSLVALVNWQKAGEISLSEHHRHIFGPCFIKSRFALDWECHEHTSKITTVGDYCRSDASLMQFGFNVHRSQMILKATTAIWHLLQNGSHKFNASQIWSSEMCHFFGCTSYTAV